ncbi:hypothetical protein JCM8097_008752 [Rhodosporidiobolus ruineniae]
MKLSLALTSAFAALAAAAPTLLVKKSTFPSGWTGAAYTGTLVSPLQGDVLTVGGNLTFSYSAVAEDASTPRFPSSIASLDVGLQGPAPVVASTADWAPYGIRQLATGLATDGPGGWVNASVPLGDWVYEAGEYFLIVTEHQREVYVEGQPEWQVVSYNVSLTVEKA